MLHNKESLVSREESHLKCTASSDGFVGVERGADVCSKKLGDSFFDGWDSSGSSNYLYCIDIIPAQLCPANRHMTQFILTINCFNEMYLHKFYQI